MFYTLLFWYKTTEAEFSSALCYTPLRLVDPRKGRGEGGACRPSFPITTAVVCLNMTEKEVNREFSDLVPSPGLGSWASLSAARPPLCCSQRREVCAELLRGPCSGAASPASAGSPPPPWSVNHSVNQRQSMKAVPRQWAICSIVVDRRSLTGELSPSCARPTADDRVTSDHFVGKPSAIGQPTRPTQPYILLGSINVLCFDVCHYEQAVAPSGEC